MSWLFTIALVFVSVGVALTTRKIQRQNATVTRRGPVPGYSCTPGVNVDLGNLSGGACGVPWTIVRLEEFHSPSRTRLILSLDVDPGADDADLRDGMLEVARRLRERVCVDLVIVDTAKLRLLFAPDGLGWSGEGSHDVLFSGKSK